MIRQLIVCALVLLAGCGGSSPTQPPAPPPSPGQPVPTTYTIVGAVTATNGGQSLAGAIVEAAAVSATSDSAGRYSLTVPIASASPAFILSGPGLMTRTGYFSGAASRTVDLDAFVLDRFDPQYFRVLARNGHEQPDSLQPLRRWTRAPLIYIQTVDDEGRAILPEVLQQVVSIASNVIPQYTNGRFGVAGFEQGTATRRGQAGWITVEWTGDEEFCGQADIGREGGVITLTYDVRGCSCGSQKIRPRTVKHEIGHALGLWHTGQSADLMSGMGVAECDRNMTTRELQYLDYLYRRPVGNTDPDNDPRSAMLLTPVRVIN